MSDFDHIKALARECVEKFPPDQAEAEMSRALANDPKAGDEAIRLVAASYAEEIGRVLESHIQAGGSTDDSILTSLEAQKSFEEAVRRRLRSKLAGANTKAAPNTEREEKPLRKREQIRGAVEPVKQS